MNKNKIIPAILTTFLAVTSNSAAAESLKINDAQAEADELAGARSIVKTKCQDCFEVEIAVSNFLSDSCNTEQNWSQYKEVMLKNAMYSYLLGLKNHGVHENVYEVILKSAQNTVDCESSIDWVKKTKDLTVYFLMN